jgi:CheY-like chemotaxis protein
MDRRRKLVLVGDSLLLDVVEVSLGANPDLSVTRVRAAVPDAEERIRSLSPDLVIFDLTAPQLAFVIPLLREQPGVPLIGLDINTSQVVALSGQPYVTLTANDLVDIIQQHVPHGNGNGNEHRGALAHGQDNSSAQRIQALSRWYSPAEAERIAEALLPT